MALSTSTKARCLRERSLLASSRSGQTWYMDFAIALLLFTFTLVVYFSYTTNFQKQEKGSLEAMVKDAKSISSSLVLSGYPNDWKNKTVIRIGLADEQKLNATKVKNFKEMDYNRTRKIFATPYNYFVFFVNENGEVLNVNTVCGVGHPIVSTKYIGKSAYYYSSESDKFLKDFMNETFNADIYKDDMDSLMSNISKYQFLVMEHPNLPTSVYNTHKDKLEDYSSNGSLSFLMISGELVTAQDKELVGAEFRKLAGQSESQRTAIVNNTDIYLSLTVGQTMVFNQYYYVQNDTSASPPSIDFKIIAQYNQTWDNAIARWGYGNGTVYFFSDFDVDFFSGDFIEVVEDVAKALISGTCTPVNETLAKPKNLAKTERYLNYNSKVVRMVVYVWE